MSTATSFALLVTVTVLFAWAWELGLPKRPTGGLRGLIVVGLVCGFLVGWLAELAQVSWGPSPGGVNLGFGLVGSCGAISLVGVRELIRRQRRQRRA